MLLCRAIETHALRYYRAFKCWILHMLVGISIQILHTNTLQCVRSLLFLSLAFNDSYLWNHSFMCLIFGWFSLLWLLIITWIINYNLLFFQTGKTRRKSLRTGASSDEVRNFKIILYSTHVHYPFSAKPCTLTPPCRLKKVKTSTIIFLK